MNTLACAKLSTPIMLKISVSPLVSMNSRRPYTTPLMSEIVASSSIGRRGLEGTVRRRALLRALHLAGRRQRGRLAVDLRVGLPPEARAFRVVLLPALERGDVQRLQDLVVVGAHLDLAERGLHLQAFERAGHLHGVVRLRLLRGGGEQLPHRLRAPVGVFV